MKQVLRAFLFLTLIMIVTACGTAPPPQQAVQTTQTTPKTTENSSAATTTDQTPVAQLEKTKATIKVYYSNSDATKLEEEQQEISYQDDQEKYEQVMALLGKSSQKGHEPLWSDFHYHSIKFKDGQLTIDSSGKNQYNLGSTGELYALEALTKSYFQFPEINEIVILVDGKRTDSLMGHMDISEPLTRDSLK